jgi:methylmalonyl-CoA mutase cobalamin-binding domain/chain
MERVFRVLLSRDDWYHQRGYWVIANTFRNAGMEVVLGGIQTPAEIARTALNEDVDLIGYRIMQAAPDMVIKALFQEMKVNGIEGLPVVVGGIVSDREEKIIRELGVKAVFRSFDRLETVQKQVRAIAEEPQARA